MHSPPIGIETPTNFPLYTTYCVDNYYSNATHVSFVQVLVIVKMKSSRHFVVRSMDGWNVLV